MRVAVIGLGLIGGSIALALRAHAHDRDAGVRERARARGIAVEETVAATVANAEVVIVAVPTEETPDVLRHVALLAPEAVLTDVASLKRPVARAAKLFPADVRFVGGHPMAGSTRRGVESADAGIFHGRTWFLVATERSDVHALAIVGEVVRATGARPLVVGADRHDALMAAVSHLPLAVAACLSRAVAEHAGAGLRSAAGPGFLDTTRLAKTPSELALELVFADPGALAGAIEWVRRELRDLQTALRASEELGVPWARAFFEVAAGYRAELDATSEESTSK